ncbi:MAG TPA: DUF4142 domain-containing protein [Xanthobacteraceae bacterium]|nr:DUF4142 domain-containing protein [Xanthobacteraceae bacterium]
MRKIILSGIALAAALLAAMPALAQSKASQQFIKTAIEGNLSEMRMGKLAQQKGASEETRAYGRELEQNHTAANAKAVALAQQLGVKPPTEPSKAQRAAYNRISKFSGTKFDREFAKYMVKDHKEDIADFQKEAKRKDDRLMGYVNDTLPVLRKHLADAQTLERQATAARAAAQGNEAR